jgi:hypothetical protein
LRESGVYEKWVKNSVNLNGFGPDIDMIDSVTYDYSPLSLSHLKGVFYFMISGIIFSIFPLLIFENFL